MRVCCFQLRVLPVHTMSSAAVLAADWPMQLAAIGQPVRFVTVAPEDYRKQLEAAGTPPELTDLLMYLFTTVLDGRNARVAVGVLRALGRAPRDFATYVRATAHAGVWRTAA